MVIELIATEKEIHKYYNCCGVHFFLYIVMIIMLVLFAGMMSGLTLGLMSMNIVDLEVLRKSGKRRDRLRACMYHIYHFICLFAYSFLRILLFSAYLIC